MADTPDTLRESEHHRWYPWFERAIRFNLSATNVLHVRLQSIAVSILQLTLLLSFVASMQICGNRSFRQAFAARIGLDRYSLHSEYRFADAQAAGTTLIGVYGWGRGEPRSLSLSSSITKSITVARKYRESSRSPGQFLRADPRAFGFALTRESLAPLQ